MQPPCRELTGARSVAAPRAHVWATLPLQMMHMHTQSSTSIDGSYSAPPHLVGVPQPDGSRLQTVQLPHAAIPMHVGNKMEGLAAAVVVVLVGQDGMRCRKTVVHRPDAVAVANRLPCHAGV